MDTTGSYPLIKLTVGALCTIGLYSVLYKETKLYRFFEHIFLGLASGWALYFLWGETLKPTWWDRLVGTVAEGTNPEVPGYWAWAFLLPIGIMAYFVFSKKHNWISRVPIGIILGLWSGQQVQVWFTRYGAQMENSMKPIVPNTWSSFIVPADPEPGALYPSQAIGNIVFLITLISAMSYFLFSFETKSKFFNKMTLWGRWLLMIGFGAIFGSTVMTRFTLMIDRMYYVFIEFMWQGLLRRP
ncbi:MAG: hypothetical protein KIS66_12045 [Fimbriimonadaceae bacterium]|nr:hypothetical protein [Fimbriimonadaceae bacterium]